MLKVVLQIIRLKSDPFNTNPISSSPKGLNAKAKFKYYFQKRVIISCGTVFSYFRI